MTETKNIVGVRIFFILLFLTIFIDQITKSYFYALAEAAPTWGAIGLRAYKNSNFMTGSFGHLPASARVTLVAALCSLFVSIGIFIFTLFEVNRNLYLGLSLLFGGFCGNVIDKVVLGYARDFVAIKISNGGVILNVADLFQWAGIVFLIIFAIGFIRAPVRPEFRGQLWIKPQLQKRILLRLAGLMLPIPLILGAYSTAFVSTLESEELRAFSVGFLVLLLALTILSIAFGLIFSHRIAGPLVALERSLKNWREGGDANFKLRRGDILTDVEDFKKYYTDVNVSPKKP